MCCDIICTFFIHLIQIDVNSLYSRLFRESVIGIPLEFVFNDLFYEVLDMAYGVLIKDFLV